MVTAAPYVRPFEEVRGMMLERARERRNPFTWAKYDEVEGVLNRLTSADRDAWADAFGALAEPYEQRAAEAEAKGDNRQALENYLLAYDYWRVARYPAPNSPRKQHAYWRSVELYQKAGRYFDPPLERVEIPFSGRPGEGTRIVAYLRRPRNVTRPAVVLNWGGIDSFKEERKLDPYIKAGVATLAMDMPGVGEAPIPGSEDAERLWDPVLDWLAAHPELDGSRVAATGGSTGGYWAAKLAHTHRDRIRAAVCQGGAIHYAFQPEWIEKAQYGEYPFELAETLAAAFGLSTYEEWIENAPRFSLLTQGVLDQPCAPLLGVNGVEDSVFPVQDMYLLLEHGSPKSMRLFAGVGHMGGSHAHDVMIPWVVERLR